MAFHISKCQQWETIAPGTPVSIIFAVFTGPNQPMIPSIVYSGPVNEDMVTALANVGIQYNYGDAYPVEEQGLMWSTVDDKLAVSICSARTRVTEENPFESYDATDNGIRYNTDVGSANVMGFAEFAFVDGSDVVYIGPTENPPGPDNNFTTDVFGAFLPGINEEPEIILTDDILLISNPTAKNLGMAVKHPANAEFENLGFGITDVSPTEHHFCISPRQLVENTGPNTSPCIDLNGYFAIEVNGELIPHYFKPDQLQQFFDQSPDYGIKVEPCDGISCTPTSIDANNNNAITGDYMIEFGFGGGERIVFAGNRETPIHPYDLFQEFIQYIWSDPSSLGILVGGGGGYGNWQSFSGHLAGADGSGNGSGPTGGGAMLLSFYRPVQFPSDGFTDLMEHWFGGIDGPAPDQIDIWSCGSQDFMGVGDNQ